MKAPDFSLPDQNNEIHTLSEYTGKWLVVYFYPADDTPGCTTEACSFRDKRQEFLNHGVEIVGISKNSVKSHKKFEDKYHLNFTLLADPDHKVIEAYGSWKEKSMFGKKYMGINRDTYLINPEGEIVKKYIGVDPSKHVAEILNDMADLTKSTA